MKRLDHKRIAEDKAMRALKRKRKWASAREIGVSANLTWRCAARALLRLVAKGEAEARVIEWKDKEHRPRESRLYRATPKIWLEGFPAWMILPPQK